MSEPKVTLICRKQDKSLVDQVAQQAAADYKAKTGQSVSLDVDNSTFLPPGPEEGAPDFWYFHIIFLALN